MLQIEDAVKLLQEQVKPVTQIQEVSLLDGIGRVLAEEERAAADQPPFPRSPLDGYAVRGEDTLGAGKESPVCLRVVGKVYAGEVFSGMVKEGEAVRIMTGAPIPAGADTVIRQEDSDQGEELVQIYRESRPYENYCYQGEDYRAGTVLLESGTVLKGCGAALAASLGLDRVKVYQKPRIAVVSTGDELIEPGQALMPGKIYDSNRYYIAGRLMELGISPVCSCHCGDEPEEMAEKLCSLSASADFVITTGGVSVGEKDIMHKVVRLLGAKQLFWRVDVKPGAPTLAAVFQGMLILCLSGNPFAAAANFELLARPVMEKLTRDSRWRLKKQKVILENDYRKPAGARRFIRGYAENGRARIALGNQASGALSALCGCNCLIEIEREQPGARAGDKVWAYLL